MKEHTTLRPFGSLVTEAGGHFAAVVRGATIDGAQQPCEALIVCDAEAGETLAKWGEYGSNTPGTSSRTDGRANTEAMAAAKCPAALAIHGKAIAGHSDWFVPSIGEMNCAAANAPELFAPNGVYWTSTQGSARYAFVQDFEYGDSYWGDKGTTRRVRAFRRIPLDTLIA